MIRFPSKIQTNCWVQLTVVSYACDPTIGGQNPSDALPISQANSEAILQVPTLVSDSKLPLVVIFSSICHCSLSTCSALQWILLCDTEQVCVVSK